MKSLIPIVRNAGEGDKQSFFGGGLHTWKLLAEDTDGAFFLFEDTMVKDKTTPLHLHPEAHEMTYVVDGEIEVQAEDAAGTQRAHPRVVEVAAAQRAQSGQQLVHVERLGEVVLRARIQTGHPLRGVGERGQHQHGEGESAAPPPVQQVQPLDRRQPSVQDDHVVAAGEPEMQPGVPVAGDVDPVALVPEQLAQHPGELGVVLDEQQPRTGATRCDRRRRRSHAAIILTDGQMRPEAHLPRSIA